MLRSSTTSVVGGNGNDILRVPSGHSLFDTTFDGGKGSDTLDLTNYSTRGVTIQLIDGYIHSNGSSVTDVAYTGVPAASAPLTGSVRGTIKNVENLTGSAGNDVLVVDIKGVVTTINGGDGNDYLYANVYDNSATLIGGHGNDWLLSLAPSTTLVGGTMDATGAHGDGQRDFFELGPYATILDFELGTDRLIFSSNHSMDAAFAAGQWISDGKGGSTFMVNGAAEVTLAGIAPALAQTIDYGFHYVPDNGVLQGSSGKDVLQTNVNQVDRVIVGANSNDDIVTHFDPAMDVLQFNDGLQPNWSDSVVNGMPSLLATFAGGSLTLTGLTTADLANMHIDGVSGFPSTSTPMLSYWSVSTDHLV
ncbi:hypothetical protein [Sphingomonas flavescens]|uniref:hypothetical protein n=1 Tax=Sphingomonas flavescens TaxID=3132797 RepID=UPI0028054162|nr:hypothetical protein [Sphingomonas limnosediminicola]